MFKFFARRREEKQRQKAAYQLGYDASTRIITAVDGYLDSRLPELSRNLLAVLSERFTTIYDQPEHEPELLARIEWKIFDEHLDTFPDRVKQELQQNIGNWLDLADFGGRELVDVYIQNRIDGVVNELKLLSLSMLGEVIDVLEKEPKKG